MIMSDLCLFPGVCRKLWYIPCTQVIRKGIIFQTGNSFLMTSAIVKIKTREHPTRVITDRLAGIPGVIDVYPVTGNYDLVAIIEVADTSAGRHLVEEQILLVDGIQSARLTNTL